jgi:ribosomal protein S13
MGSPVGVHTEDEVKGLNDEDLKQLKEHIVQQLKTSAEIHAIIAADPKILTQHDGIREILRRESSPVLSRLGNK